MNESDIEKERRAESRRPELPRRYAGTRLEMPGEMRLIGKTAHRRHLGRCLTGAQEAPRPADAYIRQIGMRCDMKFPAKGTDEMRTAEAGDGGQLLKADIGFVMVVKIVPGGMDRRSFTGFHRQDDGAAVPAEQGGKNRKHALIRFQRTGFRLQPPMRHLKGGGHLRIARQEFRERRRAVKSPARHILDNVAQQRRVGIDHPVTITAAARRAVMYLVRIDEIEMPRPRLFRGSLDGGNLRAAFDRADREGIMRVRRIFMGEKRRTQALHAAETPVTPETRGFRRGNRHGIYGLFLRNIVHERSLEHSILTVLNKSARVPAVPINRTHGMTDDFEETFAETETDAFEHAPLRLTVDLGALADNWRDMKKRSGKARTAAVVKADAYGLGIEDCGATLYHAGARDFFVATVAEGATLRSYAPEARIFVLSGIWQGQERQVFDNDLVPVLASEEQLSFWMATVAERGDHPCALHVDTGFNRLGLPLDDALFLADDVTRPASFDPVLVLSHLACADTPSSPMNRAQLESFRKVSAAFEGIESSLSASAGIFLGPDYHFDLTRPGIALYGGEAVNDVANPMRPVARAEARIIQIREAGEGQTVSYGGSFLLKRASRLAIASVGYADGYQRSLSGSGIPLREMGHGGAYGVVNGHRVPVAGRVTMDLTIFDVTDVPANAIRSGDYIELFGPNVPVDETARAAGTIGYEMLTGLGLRYERQYLMADD